MDADTKTILISTVLVTGLWAAGHYWYRLEQQKLVVEAITNTTKTLNESVQASSNNLHRMVKIEPQPQPEWITIKGQSKEHCLKQSAGVLDHAYLRCREGWQEKVIWRNGSKVVLQERPIPRHGR